jgi:hypothetical protein
MEEHPGEAEVSAEEIRRLVGYDPETGVFVWKHREEGTAGCSLGWNGKNAGKVAGTTMGLGYRMLTFFNRKFLAHRVAWCYVHGSWPPDQIDHINMIRDDNRIVNLRLATNQLNTVNRTAQANNVCGYRGVRLHKASGLWHARITVGGREHSLGYWKTAEDASKCYRVVSRLLHGDFSREDDVDEAV